MNKETINNAIQFLERVQLNGKEVGAYVEVITALSNLIKEDKKK